VGRSGGKGSGMTRAELDKLTKIRDDAKGSFWDFEKWRVMARLDQFIADAAHKLEAEGSSEGLREGPQARSHHSSMRRQGPGADA
jgi:hypothetical protein